MRSLLLVGCVLAFVASAASAKTIEEFYGVYEGATADTVGTELSRRDLAVEIRARKKGGFELTWTTVIKRSSGKVKRKSHTVSFVSAGKKNMYASAMRTNLFGKAVPLDPLKGDPYVWATLEGDTLTVHALVITEDQGYEMQTYRRTLTDEGLALEFHRVRDGQRLKDVRGTLVRTKE